MSSPPWYMHLPYGISLPLQMCTRNRQKGQGEKKARDEGMNKENDAWGVQDEWEKKLKQKTKQNATKHKVNMTC